MIANISEYAVVHIIEVQNLYYRYVLTYVPTHVHTYVPVVVLSCV